MFALWIFLFSLRSETVIGSKLVFLWYADRREIDPYLVVAGENLSYRADLTIWLSIRVFWVLIWAEERVYFNIIGTLIIKYLHHYFIHTPLFSLLEIIK